MHAQIQAFFLCSPLHTQACIFRMMTVALMATLFLLFTIMQADTAHFKDVFAACIETMFPKLLLGT